MKFGEKGYVTKNSAHQEILKAIEEVMNGRIYVCTEMKDNLSDQILNKKRPDTKNSLRETEIVKLTKEGLSSKEISSRLNIVTRTVEVHRHNILKKLKLKNTASSQV